MQKITRAVIPVAGLGTRFLPATKAMPKEMLPVVDKPAIQYVVEEAVSAGLEHILMITGRNKTALENHFDRAVELEALLEHKGDHRKLDLVDESTQLADIHYVRQGDPYGLGHAVSKAETFVGHEAFALLLGDDLIGDDERLLSEMIELAESTGSSVVALMEVPISEVHKYGVADISIPDDSSTAVIQGFIEKPSIANAPSNLVVIGRYVLQPTVFAALSEISEGVGGELQLTDALELMAKDPERFGVVLGIHFRGERYDTGDKQSYLRAIVEIAAKRDDLGQEFKYWLKDFSANL